MAHSGGGTEQTSRGDGAGNQSNSLSVAPEGTTAVRLHQNLQRLYGSLSQLNHGSRSSLPDIAEEAEAISGEPSVRGTQTGMQRGAGSAPSTSSQTNLVKAVLRGSQEDLLGLEGSSIPVALPLTTSRQAQEMGSDASIEKPSSAYSESRTLFISNVNPAVDDEALRDYLMCFGDVHSFYTAAKHRGYVVVSYHDVRAATLARHTLHGQTWQGRQLSCHQAPVGDGIGTASPTSMVLVSSLDGGKSLDNVFYVLSSYGELRDLRSHPSRADLCYAEYYDGRHASAAIAGIASSPEFAGQLLAVEAGSAAAAQLESSDQYSSLESLNVQKPTAVHQRTTSSGASGIDLAGMTRSLSQISLDNASLESHPVGSAMSLPQGALAGLSAGDLTSLANVQQASSQPLRGFASTGSIWQMAASLGQSPPMNSGIWPESQQQQQLSESLAYQQAQRVATNAMLQQQQAAAAAAAATLSQVQQQAAVQAAIQQAFLASQTNGTNFNRGYNAEIQSNALLAGQLAGGGFDRPMAGPAIIGGGGLPRRGFSEPSLGGRLARRPLDPAAEAERRAQQERLYGLDLQRIAAGEDKRTTLMIKNIPNKYTQKMLLTLLEERFSGFSPFPFDFFYLPIDFKNRCNVGYAFINMTSPFAIPKLVEEFHGRRWPKFNSEKICCIAYARIQGRNALIQHFQNSSLLHEDKRCRPVLFTTAGEIEAFPGLGALQSIVSSGSSNNLSASMGGLAFGALSQSQQ